MTSSRRSFIAGMGGFAFASAVGGCRPWECANGKSRPLLGLQLYSLHKIFWKEPERVLASLKGCGYDGVEFYNQNGLSAKALSKMCADAGIRPIGTHLNGDVDLVGDNLKRTLDYAAEAGFESLVTPHAQRDSADGYREFGHAMGLAAEAADAFGIKVGIHSTYHHFTTRYNGVTAWDLIYSEASPKLYQQVDTANTFHTGYDLVGLLEKYRGRHFSVHLKENVPTVDGVFGVPPTDGGKCVPWSDVIRVLKRDDSLTWWIVEAEGKPDSTEPAAACLAQLKRWI